MQNLSVVGKHVHGIYILLYTVSYGFAIINNKIKIYPITIIRQPSDFHLNSF